MQLVTERLLAEYLRDDWILELMRREAGPGDAVSVTQRWHLDSAPKRMICAWLYGDLLRDGRRRRVLDVGGGLWSVSRLLAAVHDYTLMDILAHDVPARAPIEQQVGRTFVVDRDWYTVFPERGDRYDVIIANDLFPNVDQRLALFLDKALPVVREVRLSITFYNRPRFYQCQSLKTDEVFWMLAWDSEQTARCLQRYRDRIHSGNFAELAENPASLYANGRQVCLIRLDGDLA